MSKLDELLQGVDIEWKTLSEIGEISGAGVDKKIIEGEKSIKLLNYMDIYRNKYITKDIPSMVVSASDIKIKQCNVLKGDIFFTPSSEVLNDIGKSSVALENIVGVVYSYHIMRLRLSNPNIITSMYVNYMLGSDNVQNQINKKAKGLTRFGLTKTQWQQIVIPIPCPDNPEKSLEIQQEIVRVLDELTTLTNQLTTELESERQNRKKQFEFFREQLFKEINLIKLGDNSVGEFIRGSGLQKKDFTETGVGCIHYGQLYTHYKTFAFETKTFVSEEFAKKARKASTGDLIIATTSENDDDVCKAVAWLGNEDIAVSSDACFYRHKFNPKYVAYYFQTEQFQKQKRKYITGTKVRRVNANDLAKILIPNPPLQEQERIVKLLDQLDATHTAIEEEITKEIKLRTQQYEYYREKLLSFPSLRAK